MPEPETLEAVAEALYKHAVEAAEREIEPTPRWEGYEASWIEEARVAIGAYLASSQPVSGGPEVPVSFKLPRSGKPFVGEQRVPADGEQPAGEDVALIASELRFLAQGSIANDEPPSAEKVLELAERLGAVGPPRTASRSTGVGERNDCCPPPAGRGGRMSDLPKQKWSGGSDLALDELRRVASAADDLARPWTWEGGYPQTVLRVGDVILVAQCFEEPDRPSVFAEFIATFDPPTVLQLLDRLAMHEGMP